MMLRSLQMATRLRHVFDPSAGYAAGATLVQHGHTVAPCSQHGTTALHPWSTVTRAVQRLYGFRPSARPEVPMSLLVLRARPLRWLVITHPSDPAGSPPPSRSVSGAAC